MKGYFTFTLWLVKEDTRLYGGIGKILPKRFSPNNKFKGHPRRFFSVRCKTLLKMHRSIKLPDEKVKIKVENSTKTTPHLEKCDLSLILYIDCKTKETGLHMFLQSCYILLNILSESEDTASFFMANAEGGHACLGQGLAY